VVGAGGGRRDYIGGIEMLKQCDRMWNRWEPPLHFFPNQTTKSFFKKN
jgi:hypothetical protein